jgi:hypothetical protein
VHKQIELLARDDCNTRWVLPLKLARWLMETVCSECGEPIDSLGCEEDPLGQSGRFHFRAITRAQRLSEGDILR